MKKIKTNTQLITPVDTETSLQRCCDVAIQLFSDVAI